MRKKIKVEDLRLGMYLQAFEGAWLDNPFWRNSFVIDDPADLQKIRASKIREVWIDTSRGADVGASPPPVVSTGAGPAIVSAPERTPQPAAEAAPARTPLPPLEGSVPIAAEFRRAARICAESRRAVAEMFREARMGKAIDNEQVGKMVQDISDSVVRNPSALISLARLKTADDYTYMHSVAVCAMMIALARQLGLGDEETREAGVAGLLHDMGKAQLPLAVLNKPGKLTPEEFAIVRSHPEHGHRMLLSAGNVTPLALDVCLHHHEKMDGSGYPDRLVGEQISLHARMGAVCDVYDAITSNRPYKEGWDPAESMRKMGEWAGSHFDVAVFQAFAKSLGIYPVGSLVRLASGRIGVVMSQSPKSLTMPVVRAFFSTKSNERIPPEDIDLSRPGTREKIVARENPDKWKFRDLDEMWSTPSG